MTYQPVSIENSGGLHPWIDNGRCTDPDGHPFADGRCQVETFGRPGYGGWRWSYRDWCFMVDNKATKANLQRLWGIRSYSSMTHWLDVDKKERNPDNDKSH